MKKLFSLFLLMAIAFSVTAQQTVPRFGTKKNEDNTGRTLNYKVAPTITDAVGVDSAVINPNAFETYYRVNLNNDTLTLRSPIVTNSYLGDKIIIQVVGTSTKRLKFATPNFLSAGAATLSTGAVATIVFVFNGVRWVEQSRVVQ
jgi:hypothetical protein